MFRCSSSWSTWSYRRSRLRRSLLSNRPLHKCDLSWYCLLWYWFRFLQDVRLAVVLFCFRYPSYHVLISLGRWIKGSVAAQLKLRSVLIVLRQTAEGIEQSMSDKCTTFCFGRSASAMKNCHFEFNLFAPWPVVVTSIALVCSFFVFVAMASILMFFCCKEKRMKKIISE